MRPKKDRQIVETVTTEKPTSGWTYLVVAGTDKGSFESSVQDRLASGAKLAGGVALARDSAGAIVYAQALTA